MTIRVAPCLTILGVPQALENLENQSKNSMHGKIMEFEKNLNNGILWNNLTKPQVARKLAVGHMSSS